MPKEKEKMSVHLFLWETGFIIEVVGDKREKNLFFISYKFFFNLTPTSKG